MQKEIDAAKEKVTILDSMETGARKVAPELVSIIAEKYNMAEYELIVLYRRYHGLAPKEKEYPTDKAIEEDLADTDDLGCPRCVDCAAPVPAGMRCKTCSDKWYEQSLLKK